MWKKRTIDFILKEDEYEKLIFRFYPRRSSCHSFDENPPQKEEDIYKVYFSYAILKQKKYEPCSKSEIMFHSGCDECSMIDEVATRIPYILDGKKSITITHDGKEYKIKLLNTEIYTFAYCVTWVIRKKQHNTYDFELWTYDNVGYRFSLDKEKTKEFGLYLKNCWNYMLSHGDSI